MIVCVALLSLGSWLTYLRSLMLGSGLGFYRALLEQLLANSISQMLHSPRFGSSANCL